MRRRQPPAGDAAYRLHRHNYIASNIEGSLFTGGISCLDSTAVVSVLINSLTGSMQLAGVAASLHAIMPMAGQLITGPYTARIKNLPRFIYVICMIYRLIPLLMIPLLLAGWPPMTTAVAFLTLYTLIFFMDGLVVIPWFDVIGRTIQPDMRGQLMGNHLLIGGVLSMGMAYLIQYMMNQPDLPDGTRYAVILGAGGILTVAAGVAMLFMRDVPHRSAPPEDHKAGLPQSLAEGVRLIQHHPQIRYGLLMRVMIALCNITLPFLIVFGKTRFALDATGLTVVTFCQFGGALLSGYVWGRISRRMGNRSVIRVSLLLALIIALLGGVLCLFTGLPPLLCLAPMTVLGGMNAGSWIGMANYLLDVAGERNRPTVMVLSSLVLFICGFVPALGGALIDGIGFEALLVIMLLGVAGGLIISLRMLSAQQVMNLQHTAQED